MTERLTIGSYVGYSPRGTSEVSRQSRDACMSVKNVRGGDFTGFMKWIAREITQNLFGDIFDDESILVPMPRSAPLTAGGLWPSESVAQELLKRGVGKAVLPMLVRAKAVTKSATAAPSNRPIPRVHAESMTLNLDWTVEGNIVLIDDVVTKGATMLGAKMLFTAAAPWMDVRGFAPIRTMGLQPDVHTLIDPWISEVYGTPDWASRKDKLYVGKPAI